MSGTIGTRVFLAAGEPETNIGGNHGSWNSALAVGSANSHHHSSRSLPSSVRVGPACRLDWGHLMRVAQVLPRLYGSTERIVAHLSNALVELGHEGKLFASAQARTRATLVPVREQAIRLDRSPLTPPWRCASESARLPRPSARARRPTYTLR